MWTPFSSRRTQPRQTARSTPRPRPATARPRTAPRASRRPAGPLPWTRARGVLNLLNLTTPLGIAVALVGRARIRRGPHGLWIAEGYRFRYPMAGAFTVGNVVTTASTIGRLERVMPDILAHEGRHASQYAVLGPAFFPLYSAAAGWSWAVAGHSAARNPFETGAGLVSGGYLLAGQQVPLRGLFRDAAGAGRRLRALLGRRGGRSRAGTATRSRER